jgi:hypothetical protein
VSGLVTRGLTYPSTRSHARRRLPLRARMLPLVQPESVFLNQVIALARLYGWRHYHTHDARHSVPGYPDLTLVRGGRLIFAELKRQRGRLTAAQLEWLEDLRATCAEVYCWRPADLPVIPAILRRRTA